MGHDKHETSKGSVQRAAKSPIRSKGKLVNYALTNGDKEYLRKGVFGPIESMEVVERYVDKGMRLSLGGSLDKGGYFCIIREGAEDWQTAISVAFWGGSLQKCLVMAGYYLEAVNPDFPDKTQLPLFDDDW